MNGWTVTATAGTAAELHDREVPPEPGPIVWVHQVERPALVLGSSQSDDLLMTEAAAADAVEVCRRRSGGGIVGLERDQHVWIDVIVPSTSRLWDDDVRRAFYWLGSTWARALADVLSLSPQDDISWHDGPPTAPEAGRLICFAGLGAGEVAIGGYKVVGLSQRRTKHSARFQSAAVLRWNPDWYSRYVDAGALRKANVDLHSLKVGLPGQAQLPAHDTIVTAFLERLPSAL